MDVELTHPAYHQQLAGQLLQQVLWGLSLTSGGSGGGAVQEYAHLVAVIPSTPNPNLKITSI